MPAAGEAFPGVHDIGEHCPGWLDVVMTMVAAQAREAVRPGAASKIERAEAAQRALRATERCQTIWRTHDSADIRAGRELDYWNAFALAYSYRNEAEARRTIPKAIFELNAITYDTPKTSFDRSLSADVNQLLGELTDLLEHVAH